MSEPSVEESLRRSPAGERAPAEGWRGEIEGLDLTLSFLRNKRAHTQRFTRRVPLGLPALRRPLAFKEKP